MRWDHSSLGWLSPDKFIPMVEQDVGLMDVLIDWLIGVAIEA